MAKMLGLSYKDLRTTLTVMLSKMKENVFVINEKIGHHISKIEYMQFFKK